MGRLPIFRDALVERAHDIGVRVVVWTVNDPLTMSRLLDAGVDGIITDRLIRIPSGAGKPKALREVVKKDVDAAFGNSRWDAEMLAMAKYGFAVNPNPDLEATARQRGWTIYFPDGTRSRV